MDYEVVKAVVNGKGPKGETLAEIREIILNIMKPYNMHHVPSPEMEELDLDKFYVALHDDDNYVGAAGYKMITSTQGKTTLLAVLPEYVHQGIGMELQKARVEEMRRLGAKSIITNADRPKSISWYKKQGYHEVGKVDKIHSFGLDTINQWTTLELKITDD